MSAASTPIVEILERGKRRDGDPVVRVRCPWCGVRHWVPPRSPGHCPRTGLRFHLAGYRPRRRTRSGAPTDEGMGDAS
ncbi:hypothetical protein [Nocardia sp. NBC_00403]|uniref:hypothetical protein n=1 Tax=Nocardia sp. NBC_00403 TaxID=2975990 RepID=UPI002E1D12E1